MDAAASGARGVRRAVIRERTSRADERRLNAFAIASASMHLAGWSWWRGKLRTAKPCGPGARGWRQAGGGLQSPTGPSEPSIRQRRRQDEFVSGERAISRKTIAQGMPECSDCTCMLVCALLRTFAHETAGAASTRHSLRPLFFGRVILQTSGASRRENAESYSVVITREGG